MTDLLFSSHPHLRVSDYEDCGDHYLISAIGSQEPEACPDYGHDDPLSD